MTEESAPRGRGRPRSEEAHRAILAAVIELLPEHGLKGLTIEAVAARAGVGKTTIYRHWETRNDLIVEALQQLRPPGPPADTGGLAGDLEAIVTLQRDRLEASTLPRTMPRVLADASEDPDLLDEIVRTAVLPIRGILEECVARAVDRGELREDVDRESLVDVLHSVPVYLLLLNGGDIGALAGVPTRIVAMLTDGVSSSSGGQASARPRSSGSSRARRARSG
jgi:AcrR family transcriptional regulator